MAERDYIEQLDHALNAVLAGPRVARPPVDPEIAALLAIAEELRFMPDPRFRDRLASDLKEERIPMTPATAVNPIRTGFHTVTPYAIVDGASRLMDFLKQAFGAEEKIRVPDEQGRIRHAEVRIGDSMFQLADELPGWKAMPGAYHLYIEHVDAVYQRALDAGATTLHPLTDQSYGERGASVRDPAGNNWYRATYTSGAAGQYVPEGLRTLTPYLHPQSADQLIDFLRRAFDATLEGRYAAPDGRVMHARVRIGDSVVEMGEPQGGQSIPTTVHLYVPDTDATYRAALEAGARSLMEPKDQPYGDRSGGVVDPEGNYWFIATHLRDVSFP